MMPKRQKFKAGLDKFIEENSDEEYEKELQSLKDYVNISDSDLNSVQNAWTALANARQDYENQYAINPNGSQAGHAKTRMATLSNELWSTVNNIAFQKDDSDALFDSVTTRAQAAALYNFSGLARNIIDIPIIDSLKSFKIENSELNDEQMQALNSAISQNKLFEKIKEATTFADLFGGGAIIPKVKGCDRYSLPKKVMMKKAQAGFIEKFTVIDHWRLTPVKHKGMPSIWEPKTIVTQYYTGNSFEDGFNIHESRMTKVFRPFAGTIGVTGSTFTGFGISSYNLMKRQILNYERAVNLIFQMLFISSRTYLTPNENFYNHTGGNANAYTSLGGTGNAAMSQTDPKEMLRQINHSMNVVNNSDSINARYLGAFKLETHDKSFQGFDDAMHALKGSLSANSGIDRERLFSDDPAGFNTGESRHEIYTSKKQQIWDFAKPAFIENINLLAVSLFIDEIDSVTLQKIINRMNVIFEGEEKTIRMQLEEAGMLDIFEGVDRNLIPASSASAYVMDKIKGMDYTSPEHEQAFKDRLERIDILDLQTEEAGHDLVDDAMDAAAIGDSQSAEELTRASQDIQSIKVENSIKLKNGKDFEIMDAFFFKGMPIKIENKAGTYREGVDKDGKPWRNLMDYDYGFICGTSGVDGEGIDVFLDDYIGHDNVYVVKQKDISKTSTWIDGICPECGHRHDNCYCESSFDEDKVMLGFKDKEAAKAAYLSQYNSDRFLGPIIELTTDDLRHIVMSGKPNISIGD